MLSNIRSRSRADEAIKRSVRFGINALPRSAAGVLVRRFPRFVPYLDDRDLPVTIDNAYYGRTRFLLSNKYRLESELLYRGAFDEKSLLYFMRLLHPGDVCIDVGANIGALTLSMAHRVGATGHVVAFEPGPLLFNRLQKNLSLSDVQNVDAHRIGLSNDTGTLFWVLETGDNSGNAWLSRDNGSVTVEVMPLDRCDFVRALPRIDLIKIDVEGMEPEVVMGAIEMIRLHLPTMLIETLLTGRAADNVKIREMLEMLSTLGYELWEIDTKESELKPYRPDFRFIPCSYPRLPQNTLCVHSSRRQTLLDV